MVRNTHERIINAPRAKIGNLIDRLGSREDELWPRDEWPPIRFDRPLAIGAKGGHGPVRYVVEDYAPGQRIVFRFLAPRGFMGTHALDVEEISSERVRVRHILEMRATGAARLTWPLIFRPLHDALIEDALDRAESFCAGKKIESRAAWTWRVWLLRVLFLFVESRNKTRNRRATRLFEPDAQAKTGKR